jgi:CcmD family protein
MMTKIANRVMAAATGLLVSCQMAFAGQEPQGGFVPASSLPQAEQIPAAPLLIAAYIFVWMALMGYLWSIWSRIGRIEKDMETLRQRAGRK